MSTFLATVISPIHDPFQASTALKGYMDLELRSLVVAITLGVVDIYIEASPFPLPLPRSVPYDVHSTYRGLYLGAHPANCVIEIFSNH